MYFLNCIRANVVPELHQSGANMNRFKKFASFIFIFDLCNFYLGLQFGQNKERKCIVNYDRHGMIRK